MELLIHFPALPAGATLEQVRDDLAELLEDDGCLLGSSPRHIDIDLLGEEDNRNPKYGILTVKYYLQKAGFPRETTLELGGMEVGVYD